MAVKISNLEVNAGEKRFYSVMAQIDALDDLPKLAKVIPGGTQAVLAAVNVGLKSMADKVGRKAIADGDPRVITVPKVAKDAKVSDYEAALASLTDEPKK